MHELIVEKFIEKMSGLSTARQVRYWTSSVPRHPIEKNINVLDDAARTLYGLSWSKRELMVTLWVSIDHIDNKSIFFIGPVTYEEWQTIVLCLKMELDFNTAGLTFEGFGNLPMTVLEDKTNGWHRIQVQCEDLNDLSYVYGFLKRQGLCNTSIYTPLSFSDRLTYYRINFSANTVEYWVQKL